MTFVSKMCVVAWLFTGLQQAAATPQVTAGDENKDKALITQAVLDYIESQQQVDATRMAKALDPKLIKRSYWHDVHGQLQIREVDYPFMVELAGRYNVNHDKFPAHPKAQVHVLDIDQRVASAKLTTDTWIDYFHLYRDDAGQWKILNVLWQYHDLKPHLQAK